MDGGCTPTPIAMYALTTPLTSLVKKPEIVA